MLSIYFENSRTIEQLSSGPAGSYLDEFASHLHLDGYASGTARRYIRAAVHLGLWVDTVNCLIEDLNKQAKKSTLVIIIKYRQKIIEVLKVN